MFFRQIRQQAAKNRRDNVLFYGSLLVAIVASYTLLSVQQQPVLRFLSTLESDAIRKLLQLVPVVYALSLFFLFFLVYFAYQYQLDRRSREFALYRMLGMRPVQLFGLLLAESLWTSLLALAIGLPLALFITEAVSLASSRLIGPGLLHYRFTFSGPAILWTIAGFIAVQALSVLLVSRRICRTEPALLLKKPVPQEQQVLAPRASLACLISGSLLLFLAYFLGLFLLGNNPFLILPLLAAGISGTFLFYKGIGGLLGRRQKNKTTGIFVFTARQIQENSLRQHKSLAIASLLLVLAISFVSYGTGIIAGQWQSEQRSVDFSLSGSAEEVKQALLDPLLAEAIASSYPVYLKRSSASFDLNDWLDRIKEQPASLIKDNVLAYLPQSLDYVIACSSYNNMLAAIGQDPLELAANTVAVFSSLPDSQLSQILNDSLKDRPSILINQQAYQTLPLLINKDLVADRSITLYAALIVPDQLYNSLGKDETAFCYNLHISQAYLAEQGLIFAVETLGERLTLLGLSFTSYLGSIGRNLFYTVSAGYLTLYLGALFLVIANTVISFKYLISQRQARQRYRTLLMLGARQETLEKSVGQQIRSFFLLLLGLSSLSGLVAAGSLLTQLSRLPEGSSTGLVLAIMLLTFGLFCGLEFFYIRLVEQVACREINKMSLGEWREELGPSGADRR